MNIAINRNNYESPIIDELISVGFSNIWTTNFDNVIDPDLIDCYIYELKAIQTRYSYLLGKAKELENKRSLDMQDTIL